MRNLRQLRHRLLQFVHGRGDGEAHVALAAAAESRAGDRGDARLFDERLGQFGAGLRAIGEAREEVERALDVEAFDAGNGVCLLYTSPSPRD